MVTWVNGATWTNEVNQKISLVNLCLCINDTTSYTLITSLLILGVVKYHYVKLK